FPRQAKYHFRCGDRVRIDPVDVSERFSAHVMIDTDQEAILEAFQPRAMNAVAFEDNRSLIASYNTIRLHHLIGKRKRAVNARNAIVQHNIGVFAHRAQHLTEGKSRSDGITVGTSMRRQHETFALSDLPQHILKHVAMPCFHWHPYVACYAFSPGLTILPLELCPVRRGPGENTTRVRAGSPTARLTRDVYIHARL